MAVFHILGVVCLLLSSSSVVFTPISATNNNIDGFTIDLIHRDSPNSPLYNSSETQTDRLRKSMDRFSKRINRINNNPAGSSIKPDGGFTIDVSSGGGEYIANLTIGTPPVQFLALVDTGSSITWTQCLPCESCFTQPTPIFDPKLSSSYKQAQCGSDVCAALPQGQGTCGSRRGGLCTYAVEYMDEAFSEGVFSTETFTLGGGSVTVLSLAFGCGTNNDNNNIPGVSGLLGLDSGPSSLISQLSPYVNGKFSYCLVPIGGLSSSKMKFGTDAVVVPGDAFISTPLVLKPKGPSGYFITLQAVAVGSEIFEITSSSTTEGNLMVDTGTTFSTLPPNVYDKVADSLTRQVQKPIVDDPSKNFKLCYATKDDITSPQLILYVPGGGLKLGMRSFLSRINEDVMCFTFIPSDRDTILGNVAQMDVWVGIDIQAKTLTFAGTDCSMQ